MEQITIGQIAVTIAFVVALIGGITSLKKLVKDGIETALKGKFEAIEKSQAEIVKRLDAVDLENCKNYLVTFLAEVERGEMKSETEIQRFWEQYERYISRGGNSYIRHKVEELKGKGLL